MGINNKIIIVQQGGVITQIYADNPNVIDIGIYNFDIVDDMNHPDNIKDSFYPDTLTKDVINKLDQAVQEITKTYDEYAAGEF